MYIYIYIYIYKFYILYNRIQMKEQKMCVEKCAWTVADMLLPFRIYQR